MVVLYSQTKNNTIQYAQKQLILGSKNGLKLTKIVHIAQIEPMKSAFYVQKGNI